ncbi:G protein-coupled glucose receptor regulating Gpa2-domain-containing protein [Hypoxylon crocopeplum]|nr:G protein-coupled glucose receptor regulating Gpa2-domain-containing protein [Hypoxylon crocopeplum]
MMAPLVEPQVLSSFIEHFSSRGSPFSKRDLAREPTTSDPKLVTLSSISLSMASVSVFSALFAFYWFVRMRRGFRHDLIMLLIQSDMMKALWLVICPVAFFAKVPITSKSAFCQVSGFFLTASIEASDMAVLLIAIHTALCILRPQRSSGAAGLYPYRRIAYACWALIPIILAAVVPITQGKFVDNGPHCYLPVHPTWYRSALSWIPRYIIFAIIILTYMYLYLYLALRLRRFRRDQRCASVSHNDRLEHTRNNSRRSRYSSEVPPTPPIADHGLLNPAQDNLPQDRDPKECQQSFFSTTSTLNAPPRQPGQAWKGSIKWNTVDFSQDSSFETQARQESEAGLVHSISPSDERAGATIPIRAPESVHHNSRRPSQQSERTHSIWKRSMSFGSHSIKSPVANVINSLRRGSLQPEDPSQTTPRSSIYLSQSETELTMCRVRERQQRQLRLLFVYPVVYLLTWVTPFVSHAVRFNDDYVYDGRASSMSPPLGLRIVSVTSLCIGAAVDCCFFCAWEKPWQHLRGGFWEGLALKLRIRSPMRRRTGPGRTRDERFADARTARLRREQEENLENLGNEAATAARRDSQRGPQQGPAPREWWDVLEVDYSETSARSLV